MPTFTRKLRSGRRVLGRGPRGTRAMSMCVRQQHPPPPPHALERQEEAISEGTWAAVATARLRNKPHTAAEQRTSWSLGRLGQGAPSPSLPRNGEGLAGAGGGGGPGPRRGSRGQSSLRTELMKKVAGGPPPQVPVFRAP